RADPHVPADRGQALPPHGGDDLAGRDRLPRADADADPRAGEPALPPAAVRAGEPAAALAAPPVLAGARLLPAPAGGADRRRRRAARAEPGDVHVPGQGVPARAG